MEKRQYLASDDKPTIADIQVYNECVNTIEFMNVDTSTYANVNAWMERLQELEEVKNMDQSFKTYLVENKEVIEGWKNNVAEAIK